jgi:hypothetical protein
MVVVLFPPQHPEHIKRAKSVAAFKTKLKTFIFKKYFN